MRVDTALLCDAATVREGLLNILSGGITRVRVPDFPGQMNTALALRILEHTTEAGNPHTLEVILQDEDGKRIMEASLEFQSDPSADLKPGEDLCLPIGMGLNGPLPKAGAYSFEILIDKVHQTSVSFWAEKQS